MAAEMAEQPGVIGRLIQRRDSVVATVRRVIPAHLCGIVLVARGSSDHAALYGRYLMEMVAGRPVALAAPSLHTLYQARVDHRGWVAIAISQSGETPEIVSVLGRMRESGAVSVAVANQPGSPLAAAADVAVELEAGFEKAVPATKTFTATLVALALVAEAFGQVPWQPGQLEGLPEGIEWVLDDGDPAEQVASSLVGAREVLVTSRGLLLAAAMEVALKIREAATLYAEGISAADLRHGPIAAIKEGSSVLAFSGPSVAADLEDLVGTLRSRGAAVSVAAPGAGNELPLPEGVPEALLPVLAAVRGQQVAHRLALLRGLDPDAPTGLRKVTMTR